MVHLSWLARLQNQGQGGTFFRPHQVMVNRRDSQQGRQGHMGLIHAPVCQDQDGSPLLIGLIHLQEEPLQRPVKGRILIADDGGLRHREAGHVHMLDFQQIRVGEDRIVYLQHLAVFRALQEDVSFPSDVHAGVSDDLFPGRVDGRVSHLGEALLKVIKQRLALSGQGRQRRIHAHGGDALRAV